MSLEEHREHAERLKLLPRAVQRQVLAIYRTDAERPGIGKKDRQISLARVEALETLLKLKAPRTK